MDFVAIFSLLSKSFIYNVYFFKLLLIPEIVLFRIKSQPGVAYNSVFSDIEKEKTFIFNISNFSNIILSKIVILIKTLSVLGTLT